MPDNKRITLPPIEDVPWYQLPEPVAEVQDVDTAPNNKLAALMTMKAALVEVTASRGWMFVERFAETGVRELETKALDEDDDATANGLRRDARGARKFKDDLFKRINIGRNFDSADGFVEVVTD